MPSESKTQQRPRQRAAGMAAGVAGAIALALCCGGAVLAAIFGLSVLAALLVNPWFLIPVVGTAAGAVYWRTTRRNQACDVPPGQVGKDEQ